ncbi:MAG: adenylate/guanylate cyclase domain-containing protein [Actinobacteria bacterium]|nr:adenylate/guanylate cyclase domain-containing protein [Actinomycetota bacterium]
MIVAISVGGAAVIGLGTTLVIRRILRKRREAREAARRKTPTQRVIAAGLKVGEIALRELGPLVASSLQGLVSWVQSTRPDLSPDLAEDGTITLVFSDIEDSTERNVDLGDERWLEILRTHDDIVRPAVKEHQGHVVKSQGDGYMLAFRSPLDAVMCATYLCDELERAVDLDQPLRVRYGVHTGSALSEDGDFFGANVAFAARVADAAAGGEVVASEDVRHRCADVDGVRFEHLRTVRFKGLPGNHDLYRVARRDARSTT